MATVTTSSRLPERWPTALGLVLAAVAAAVILGTDVDEIADEFAPGVATMMGIYLAAYALGAPLAAWLAFAVLVVVAALVGDLLDVNAGVAMTAILGLLWLWILARGRSSDRPWFTIQTLGMVFFGGLTIARLLPTPGSLGSWPASDGSRTASGTPTTSPRTGLSSGRGPSSVPWSISRSGHC
jgi:hypothetical protein